MRPSCRLHGCNAGTGAAGMDAKRVVLMLHRVSAAEAVSAASVDNFRVSWSERLVRRHGSPCRLEIPGGTVGERSSRWRRRHARGGDPTERAER